MNESVQNIDLVHPSFSFSRAEFDRLISSLPEQVRTLISRRPAEFLDQLIALSTEPEELTWLVDKQHNLDADYEPADLVELDSYAGRLDLTHPERRFRAAALGDLFAMVDAARAEGITLPITSAYRSHDYQEGIYAYWVNELGQEEADRVSARPGASQHQLGTVIDFGCICEEFAETDAGRWLAANAGRFGFSMSYPDDSEALTGYGYESWHFRYIGSTAAQMQNEFFDGTQAYLTEFVKTNLRLFMSFLIEN